MAADFSEITAQFDRIGTVYGLNETEELKKEYTNYVVSCALSVWGSHDFYSENYAELLKLLTGTDYTMAQIVTAMHCCTGSDVRIGPPPFFITLLLSHKSPARRSFCTDFQELLVSLAFVNGDFTIEEAAKVSELSSALAGYVLRDDPSGTVDTGSFESRVTGLHRTGIWNNAVEESRSGERSGSRKDEEKSRDLSTADPDIRDAQAHIAGDSSEKPSHVSPGEDGDTLNSLLEELNALVGLDSVKSDVISLINFIKVCNLRREKGMKVPSISYHLVFTGNPGTGKTTIARLVAKIYNQLGILSEGQLIEADRASLVGGYLGQTAIKTKSVIESAIGGVLFIDEAYSLVNGENDSYGQEAIETLLKEMEDNRDRLIVIAAGYTDQMHTFIESNPGLRSRFNKYFEFPDYNGDNLLKIFRSFCDRNGYLLSDNADNFLKEKFDSLYLNRDKHFGNARLARNVFEKAINIQANRIAGMADIDDTTLATLTTKDVTDALEEC